MTNQIILQNLRDFTVQIRRPQDEAIVGTGIAVSLDGRIITCAHVVQTALGCHPRQANGAEIGVYFPQARGDEVKDRRATVAACFPDHDDDVVLLQLDGPPPLGLEQMPKLGTTNTSRENGFRSYGYAPVGNRLSRYAHGEIMGPVEMMSGTQLHEEPIELRTRNIRRGMSGGPVLDIERNLVVGIVTSYWLVDKDPDNIAYATNGKVLTFDPLNLPLQDAPQPKQTAPQPQPEYREAAQQLAHIRPQSQFQGAPPPLAEWVGRADLLDGLNRDYAHPDRRVTGLIGFGGEGKSSLARRWVDLLPPLGGDR
ncbi:MAG: serine protease, partial [Chloroflexi bacterium]|nr:serine protease [Chloroflexota bacterium]